jgi:hypothetical protein
LADVDIAKAIIIIMIIIVTISGFAVSGESPINGEL